jgi:uncharacterized protein
MRPSTLLEQNRKQIKQIILKHNVLNLRVFCSVVNGTDTELSDLDIVVDPTPITSLFDIGAIRFELKVMLHIEVDVLTPNVHQDSFGALVLAQAKPI